MIYTTYFSALRKLSDLPCVSIARSQPRGIYLPTIHELKPSRDLLNDYKMGDIDWFHYCVRYTTQLRHLDCDKLVKHIMSYGEDVALVCWERPEKHCHRHLVASWLKHHGYPCEELEVK